MRNNSFNKTVSGWALISFLLLVLAAIFYGYIKLLDGDNPRYKLAWNNSRWITTATASASAYFRSSFNIESGDARAVLQLAATDGYEAFFNGVRIGGKEQKSMLANGVYDVSNLIRPGKNVLAVAVSRRTYPDVAGLRYELNVIDGLGRKTRFLSIGKDEIAEGKLPTVIGMDQPWYDSMIDDALWTKAVAWAGPAEISHVSFNPDILLALPEPELKTLDSLSGWRVAAKTQFNHDGKASRHAWLGFASDVPYEVILNNKSLGIFSANDSAVDLLSVQSGLRPGLNSLSVEFMTGSAMAKVAGGIILADSSRFTYLPLDNQWQIVSQQENIAGTDMRVGRVSLPNKQIILADVPDSGVVHFVIRDDFSAPRVFQFPPFLDGLKFMAGLGLLYLLFAWRGFSLAKIINASMLGNVLTLNMMVLSWFFAQDIRFDARMVLSDNSIDMLLVFWCFLVFAQLLELSLLNKLPTVTEIKQHAIR